MLDNRHIKMYLMQAILRHYLEFETLVMHAPSGHGDGRSGNEEGRHGPMGALPSVSAGVLEYGGLSLSFYDLQGCLRKLSKLHQEALYHGVICDKPLKDVSQIMEIAMDEAEAHIQEACMQVGGLYWADDEVCKLPLAMRLAVAEQGRLKDEEGEDSNVVEKRRLNSRGIPDFGSGRICKECKGKVSRYTEPQPFTGYDLCRQHWFIPEQYFTEEKSSPRTRRSAGKSTRR